MGVIILSLKDVVKKRMKAGQRVSLLLRLYFGSGNFSLLLSFVSILVFACFAIVLFFIHVRL